MLDPLRPDVINPPAIVQAAFDEARALVEIKAAVERRNTAKGEFKHAVLVIGQRLVEARRAMPDVVGVRGARTGAYSPAFLAFIEKCGLARSTAQNYMGYVRDPRRLERARAQTNGTTVRAGWRRKTLTEVQALLAEAPDLATASRIIAEELNELAA